MTAFLYLLCSCTPECLPCLFYLAAGDIGPVIITGLQVDLPQVFRAGGVGVGMQAALLISGGVAAAQLQSPAVFCP